MKEILNTPITFPCGIKMKNKFMLAPMTNTQSFEDGTLSEEEFRWLTMRAEGGFGLVMTCASHVSPEGKGFPGQLGIYTDEQISGHQRLAAKIKEYGSLAVIQLHHAGMRSPKDLLAQSPICPSNNKENGAREMSLSEIITTKNKFVQAAVRAQKSGYDGVEVHGAHGYLLTQFLSSEINQRTDQYGGNLTNRARLLFEIIDEIREACGAHFLLGVRLSPERYGMDIFEIQEICKRLITENKVDFLDISLWDIFKMPNDEKYQNKPLLDYFTELDFKNIRLTVAGKIRSGNDVTKALESGVDFVSIGRSAILHHDFPVKVMEDINFTPVSLPVSKAYLASEGLGDKFIQYMQKWPGFVKEA